MLYYVLAFALGLVFCYLILRPKLVETIKINYDNQRRNEQTQEELAENEYHLRQASDDLAFLNQEKVRVQTEIDEKNNSAEEIFKTKITLLNERFSQTVSELKAKYKEAEEDAKNEYLKMLSEQAIDFSNESIAANEQIIELRKELQEYRSKYSAAVEEYKRAQEMETKQMFYRLQLSHVDIEEIAKIAEVGQYLRDSRPISKVIWAVYYNHAYTDLVGRVIGAGRHTGIYKLTNIKNGMVYVGQAVDIAARWKQHIKCALGAENASNNKLYPAMQEVGPENFTFEVIEECEPEELDSREQYWQDFYKAKEFGYSIK
jgi:hypothetical protein